MECKETYTYLYHYAKGKISESDREEVEKHISVCKECNAIAESLVELTKRIAHTQEGENSRHFIYFQTYDGHLRYSLRNSYIDDYQELNEQLEKCGGNIPYSRDWFTFRLTDMRSELLAALDNEGNKCSFEELERTHTYIQNRWTKMNKIYNPHESTWVFLSKEKILKPTIEHPDLMRGYIKQYANERLKLGIYTAIPSSGRNIRIKQGNGVIECGPYKFAFSERYVLDTETLVLDCSYIKE